MKTQYAVYLLVVITFMLLGFLRDFLFVNLNYQASVAYYNTNDGYNMPAIISFIENWTYKKLYYTKWMLTMVFSMVYASVTIYCINHFFKKKEYTKITLFTYFLLIILALLSYVLGLFFNDYTKGYSIARQLMGLVQSPLILMILTPAFLLSSKK